MHDNVIHAEARFRRPLFTYLDEDEVTYGPDVPVRTAEDLLSEARRHHEQAAFFRSQFSSLRPGGEG